MNCWKGSKGTIRPNKPTETVKETIDEMQREGAKQKGKEASSRITKFLRREISAQRDRWILWAAIIFAGGCAAYFALASEPGEGAVRVLNLLLFGLIAVSFWLSRGRKRRSQGLLFVFCLAIAFALAGFLLADWRTDKVAAPRLSGHYRGEIAGRVIAVDRNASGKLRILLDKVAWKEEAPPPERIRITIDSSEAGNRKIAGTRRKDVETTSKAPIQARQASGIVGRSIVGSRMNGERTDLASGHGGRESPAKPPAAGHFGDTKKPKISESTSDGLGFDTFPSLSPSNVAGHVVTASDALRRGIGELVSTRGPAALIGGCLSGKVHLAPPPVPSEAGGFDFRFSAWFLRIGAVGHAREREMVFEHGAMARSPPAPGRTGESSVKPRVGRRGDGPSASGPSDLSDPSAGKTAQVRSVAGHHGSGTSMRDSSEKETPSALGGPAGLGTPLPCPTTDPLSMVLHLEKWRLGIAKAIADRVPGDGGAFLAILATGDRSGLSPEAARAMRLSGLAHLMAISGLHMALVASFVFALVRILIALVAGGRLFGLSPRRWAAIAAICATSLYLVLSGSAVPAERAWVMVTLMLLGALLGGKVLSLRSIALAAFAVLFVAPESVMQAGFQMSFTATLALVLAFRRLNGNGQAKGGAIRKAVRATVISSLVAGLATAPFIAWHFHRLATWGFVANLVAVPLMGMVLLPALSLALLLMPFDLEAWPLRIAGLSADAILATARLTADLPGAVRPVPAGPGVALALLVAGGLLFGLWRGKVHWIGLPLLIAALLSWFGTSRPHLLIAGDGRFVGVMTPFGRALSSPKGHGYLAGMWLERDGDMADQAEAAERAGIYRDGHKIFFSGMNVEGVSLRPSATLAEAREACAAHRIVIGGPRWLGAEAPCLHLSRAYLAKGGGASIWRDSERGWRILRPRHDVGWRPWSWPVEWPAGIAPRDFTRKAQGGGRNARKGE